MTDQPTTETGNCCVCGNTPVVYRNYQEQPFCAHCADCACGKVPCVKPAPECTREQRLAELEQLRARVAELKKDAAATAEIMEKADADLDGIIETGRYFRHLAEHQRQWGDQHRDRANRYRARTDAVKAELHALNSETRGLNPVALAGRRDAVARIRAALATITHETQVPDDPRVAELEQQLADADAAADHTDRTCEAVAGRDRAEAAIERVKAECTAIVAEVYGQHDQDDDGMREAVRRIRTALGIPTGEPQPDPRCDAARAALDQPQQPAPETAQ
ncbi:hypothetical protein [Streptomyces sp. NPDC058092]|uniref:hypothetical protein n=1 Tax=Streptomyces sp. NPDC058092 TaxID=3346336 RepID=UPI0036EF132A